MEQPHFTAIAIARRDEAIAAQRASRLRLQLADLRVQLAEAEAVERRTAAALDHISRAVASS